MAFTVYSDERAKWYYQAETTFGTPIALSSTGYKLINFAKTEFPALGVSKDSVNTNRGSRVNTLADVFVDNWSGPVEFGFSFLMTLDRVADFLYAVMQNRVSQAGASGYQKVFKPHASQPDFTANAGWFGTFVWVQSDQTANAVRFTSCIVKSLTLDFSWESAGVGNIVRASGTILAKAVDIEQDFTGSATAQGTTWLKPYAYTPSLLLTAGGGDVTFAPNLRSFSLSFSNNASGIGKASTGNPVSYFLNPSGAMSANIGIWLDGDSFAALNTHRAGSTVTFSLTKGSNGVTGYHLINIKGQTTGDPLSTSTDRCTSMYLCSWAIQPQGQRTLSFTQ
jgi:hypothetical protein